MDKFELKKWVDENPDMDPRSPKVTVKQKEYEYSDKYVQLENTETGQQESFDFDCNGKRCGGCGQYFCNATAPIPGNPYPDFGQDENDGPS